MGIHCGSVTAGVANTFVLLGDDVRLAWKMEQTAEPLKIQACFEKKLLSMGVYFRLPAFQASGAVLDKLNSIEGDVTKLFDFKRR